MTAYRVNEVFETLQCEGSRTGRPSTFLRLQGCPVGCAWCDTKYTWDAGSLQTWAHVAAKTGDTPDNTCAELDGVEIARRMLDRRSPHVVITGGEPAMYDLQELTEQIALAGIPVQVETSGTYELLLDGRTWVTCSPKFDMPGGRTVLRSALERADEIKMPVGKARDVESMRHRVLPFVRIGTPIWLQPLSASPAATRLCIEQAARNGWNVSIQSHKFIGIR